MSQRETVHVVASGYDWICQGCKEEQHEDTISMDWAEGTEDLTCQSCGANYTLGDVSHCYS
jgi:hypothetical protein